MKLYRKTLVISGKRVRLEWYLPEVAEIDDTVCGHLIYGKRV